jgi:hypothetical protein
VSEPDAAATGAVGDHKLFTSRSPFHCLRSAKLLAGRYPIVFNNSASDGSFGVTGLIILEEISPNNDRLVKAVTVPDNPANGDYLTTSFSSKSELSIPQSTDGQYDTFIGYVASPGTIDASNSNTLRLRRRRTPARRRRSAISTSPSWACQPTSPGRTTTTAA